MGREHDARTAAGRPGRRLARRARWRPPRPGTARPGTRVPGVAVLGQLLVAAVAVDSRRPRRSPSPSGAGSSPATRPGQQRRRLHAARHDLVPACRRPALVADAGTGQVHDGVGTFEGAGVDRPGGGVPPRLTGGREHVGRGRSPRRLGRASAVTTELTDEPARARDDDPHARSPFPGAVLAVPRTFRVAVLGVRLRVPSTARRRSARLRAWRHSSARSWRRRGRSSA